MSQIFLINWWQPLCCCLCFLWLMYEMRLLLRCSLWLTPIANNYLRLSGTKDFQDFDESLLYIRSSWYFPLEPFSLFCHCSICWHRRAIWVASCANRSLNFFVTARLTYSFSVSKSSMWNCLNERNSIVTMCSENTSICRIFHLVLCVCVCVCVYLWYEK